MKIKQEKKWTMKKLFPLLSLLFLSGVLFGSIATASSGFNLLAFTHSLDMHAREDAIEKDVKAKQEQALREKKIREEEKARREEEKKRKEEEKKRYEIEQKRLEQKAKDSQREHERISKEIRGALRGS